MKSIYGGDSSSLPDDICSSVYESDIDTDTLKSSRSFYISLYRMIDVHAYQPMDEKVLVEYLFLVMDADSLCIESKSGFNNVG